MCRSKEEESNKNVRFEVFTAVTMKNAVFWEVAPCRSSGNRRFGGTSVPTRYTNNKKMEKSA
jgi:hypothetical protein